MLPHGAGVKRLAEFAVADSVHKCGFRRPACTAPGREWLRSASIASFRNGRRTQRTNEAGLGQLLKELDDILLGLIARDIECADDLLDDGVYGSRRVDEPPDVRADVVQREDGVEIADAADDRHDDRLVGNPTSDELAVVTAFSSDGSRVHNQIGSFQFDSTLLTAAT